MGGIPCDAGTVHRVSDLLPNLDALKEHLAGDVAGRRDALVLADAVAHAATEEDLDAALEAVIATWRQP
jgi:hypothetical protein